ncbi:MAG: replication initiation protein [Sebaldella sp.]|nr:replication initiation protein [Sebaldella sp.]
MIHFLELNRNINFFDKKIMKFILDKTDFKDQKNFTCSLIDLKQKTNQFSNLEIFKILNDFQNLRITYNIFTDKMEYTGNFSVVSSYKVINHDKLEITFSSDFINTFKKDHFLSEININIFFSFTLFYSIHLYNFLTNKLADFPYTKIDLDKLKEILNIKNNYNRIYDFEKYILQPSLNEINKLSNINFFYNKIKKNNKRNAKVLGFEFFSITEKKLDKINSILLYFNNPEDCDGLFHKIIYTLNSISYDEFLEIIKRMDNEVKNSKTKVSLETYFLSNIEKRILEYKNQYSLTTNISKIDSFNQYKSLIFESSYNINNSFLFMWNDISSIKRNQIFEYEDDILKIQSQYFDDGDKFIKIYQKK